jgi:hypothetical protein
MARTGSVVRRNGKSVAPPRSSKARPAREKARTREPKLRETGIRILGDARWGMHFCIFYQTKEDLLETAVSFFEAGLRNNELCVWAISDPVSEADALAALRRAIAGFDRYLAAGQIELLQATAWYLAGGKPDPKRITDGWIEKIRGALAKGYAGMRVSGDAFWIASDDRDMFCTYEEAFDRSPGSPSSRSAPIRSRPAARSTCSTWRAPTNAPWRGAMAIGSSWKRPR